MMYHWLTFCRVQSFCSSTVFGIVMDKHVIRHSQKISLHTRSKWYDHLKDQIIKMILKNPVKSSKMTIPNTVEVSKYWTSLEECQCQAQYEFVHWILKKAWKHVKEHSIQHNCFTNIKFAKKYFFFPLALYKVSFIFES